MRVLKSLVLAAALALAPAAHAASTLSLITGPVPAADMVAEFNTLITAINASGPFSGTLTGPTTTTYTSDSATPGTVRAVTGQATIGSGLTMTSGNMVGARGNLTVPSGTTVGTSAYLYGAQGKITGGGTFASGLNVAALVGQWDYSTGTYTSGVNSVLWLDAGATASASAVSTSFGGASQLLRMTNTTAADTTQIIDLYADAPLFMAIDGPGSQHAYASTSCTPGSVTGTTGGLKITIGGTTRWIPLAATCS